MPGPRTDVERETRALPLDTPFLGHSGWELRSARPPSPTPCGAVLPGSPIAAVQLPADRRRAGSALPDELGKTLPEADRFQFQIVVCGEHVARPEGSVAAIQRGSGRVRVQ